MQNIELYKEKEDEFAWNPLAVYRIVKHLVIDHQNMVKDMTQNSYDGKIDAIYVRVAAVLGICLAESTNHFQTS